jgi:sucrose-6-phosphate hydrolase SacC (GH32 family)
MGTPQSRLSVIGFQTGVLIGVLCMMPFSAWTAERDIEANLLANATYFWNFVGPEAKHGRHHLKPIGDCRLGVPTERDGEKCADFSGGHCNVAGSDNVSIGVEGDFSLAFRFWLEPDYFDMSKPLDATLFEWFGEDTAAQPKRHSISLEIFGVGYLPENRFLGVWVDDYCRAASLKDLESDKWLDVVFRVKDGVGEFFVNGSIPSYAPPQALSKGLLGNNPPARIVRQDTCIFGNNHRRDLPFKGRIAQAAIWDRALSDDEAAALSGVSVLDTKWQMPVDVGHRWSGHYQEDLTLEEAYKRIHKDYVAFYERVLKEDVHFPRFHLTIPAFMTEPSMSSYQTNGYHIFPHDCIHWVSLFYRADHYWQHFASDDLLHWRSMPLPQWPGVSAGNIIEQNEQAISFPVQELAEPGGYYEKWVSDDKDLKDWRMEKHIDIPSAPEAGGIIPKDPFTFRHEGQTWTVGAYAGWTRRNQDALAGRIDLYRHRDGNLDNWEHVGEFYRGNIGHVVHHPRLFFVGGKCVLDSDTPIDKDVWYLLGRVENGRFIREGGGDFNFDCGGWSWGQTITEPNGRVLRWTLIRNVNTPNNLVTDNVRSGWGNVYSLPRVMGVEGLALKQTPAPELAGLREEHLFHGEAKKLADNGVFLPKLTGDRGGIEVRCIVAIPREGRAGIVLKDDEGNRIRFFYDKIASQLVLAFDQSRNGSKASPNGLGQDAKTTMELSRGDELELTLYFDHSVIEGYANGEVTAGRWYPESPKDIQVGFFAEGSDIELKHANIWSMSTIWKEYTKE